MNWEDRIFSGNDMVNCAIIFSLFFLVVGMISGEYIQSSGMSQKIEKSVSEKGYFRLDDVVFKAAIVNTSNFSEMQQIILKINNINVSD